MLAQYIVPVVGFTLWLLSALTLRGLIACFRWWINHGDDLFNADCITDSDMFPFPREISWKE